VLPAFPVLLRTLPAADPTPIPTSTVDPNLVTPGVTGFIVTAVVIVASIVLIVDMARRMRRLRYRAEVRERLEAEAAAEDAGEGS